MGGFIGGLLTGVFADKRVASFDGTDQMCVRKRSITLTSQRRRLDQRQLGPGPEAARVQRVRALAFDPADDRSAVVGYSFVVSSIILLLLDLIRTSRSRHRR